VSKARKGGNVDLGLAGRRAIVCASSRGLGYACALSLAREGAELVLNGRDSEALRAAADRVEAETARRPGTVAADLSTPEGRKALVAACPDADILINNNAGPPPSDFYALQRRDWDAAFESNALAGLDLIQALTPGMRERKFGRIVNITSAMVKSPRPGMELSTAARAALTAACKALSRTLAPDNVTINNMLPERFDTDRQVFMAKRMMAQHGYSYEEARARIVATIPAHRFGDPKEFGDACAFLCGAQAGFISGQNIQLDGGAYDGLV
jgi:3-oxoacyl-[acyl-carrier protein] reductase